MIEYKPSEITVDLLKDRSFGTPIIICTQSQRINQRLKDAEYKRISLNMVLSSELLKIPSEERPLKIESALTQLLSENVPMVITDFEMLFDPRYQIDVLKFFCEKSRRNNVAIIWPGKYIDYKLT